MKQNLSDLSVSVGDMQVSPSSKVRDLCVVFDQYLTFHDHISGICKSTHFHLRGIGRIRNLQNCDATAQLIHALITSRLDFCNSILYNLPNKQIDSYCIYIICIILMFLQCVSTVIIVYIIISPLNSYPYIHWILDFK